MRSTLALLLIGAAACAPSRRQDLAVPPQSVSLSAEFTVLPGDASIQPSTLRFGGISALAAIGHGAEILAISDDRENSRVYRLSIELSGSSLRVVPTMVIPLEPAAGAPPKLDPEGIALTHDGNIIISSEGVLDDQQRVPPALVEYTASGRFVRQLPVPPRFLPNEAGPLTVGVRTNAGFESLTVTPDFGHLFTANELPLAQEGDDTAVARGGAGPVRIIRYDRSNDRYQPGPQFVYEISPLEEQPFPLEFAVNGLVELLALDSTELLALERGYAQSKDRAQFVNRIRIFRISLRGATDVAATDRLEPGSYVPVTKRLVVDVNALPGLSPALRSLDNFEGLAWVGLGPRRSLLVVSDDNFSARQSTAFLLLSPSSRWD